MKKTEDGNLQELVWHLLQEIREVKTDLRRIADHFDPPEQKGIEKKLDKVLAELARVASNGVQQPKSDAEGKLKWLSPAEVAKMVGITANSIREGCRGGGIKAKKWNNGWRISSSTVEEYLRTKRWPSGDGG
jgi:hypothetical protein